MDDVPKSFSALPGLGPYEVHGVVGYDTSDGACAWAFNTMGNAVEYTGEWEGDGRLVFTAIGGGGRVIYTLRKSGADRVPPHAEGRRRNLRFVFHGDVQPLTAGAEAAHDAKRSCARRRSARRHCGASLHHSFLSNSSSNHCLRGTWEKINKLRTTVSVMHITAHPDDEHGGVLAKLSFGDGARVTLLTLNRGESGDNAIGPQLFDALGLIRTEELLVAESLLRRRSAVLHLRRRLRILQDARRIDGEVGARDGVARRGPHHPAGAADHPAVAIPGQRARRARQSPGRRTDGARKRFAPRATEPVSRAAQGRPRPWQPRSSSSAAFAPNEDWTVRVDSGEYSAVLGDSFDNVARLRTELPALAERRAVHAIGRCLYRTGRITSRSQRPRRSRRSVTFFDGSADDDGADLRGAAGRPSMKPSRWRSTRSRSAILGQRESAGRGIEADPRGARRVDRSMNTA